MSYQENYLKWKNESSLKEPLKSELIKLTESEIEDAFYKELEFGTAGARGLMGVGTNRLNVYTVKKIVLGYAKYIKKQAKKTNYKIAISYDNRKNSREFAYTSASVLAQEGIESYITKELRPTPFLSYMVRHFHCDGGIMITASHNPKQYNGIKVYDKHGAQLIPEFADKLTIEVNKITDYFHIQEKDSPEYIHEVTNDLDSAYLARVKEIQLNPSLDKPLKFVYSPLHGAGATLIPTLLMSEGYKLYPVSEEMTPDGNFSHIASSNPEEFDAYNGSLKLAKKIDADMIMVTDPDADRLGVIVKHNGAYQILNGNQTASLELFYILEQLTLKNKLPKDGVVYKSNVTTPLMDEIAKLYNIKVHEVLTGFKFIGDAIEKGKLPYLFGAEESYGSLISPFVRDKDAVQAVLFLAEMATYYHEQNRSLYQVLLDIYTRVGAYAEKTISQTYEGVNGLNRISEIMAYYRENVLSLSNDEVIRVEDNLTQLATEDNHQVKIVLPKANVIKFIYKSGNIAILRPSGTEPKLKVYLYIKGKNVEEANQKLGSIEKEILQKVKEI